jgi:HEPN domain-containing protein
MRSDTLNWIALAEYDLETARYMLKTGRRIYVVFMCHMALEKMLKAHVTEATQTIPAKSHDLIYLVKKSGVTVPPAHLEFIGKINNASVPTRYPDDLQRTLNEYTDAVVQDYLQQTEKALTWLKQELLASG